jgi:hypothetical protein
MEKIKRLIKILDPFELTFATEVLIYMIYLITCL